MFTGLLRALGASKKSGTLVVTDDEIERRLYYEEGALISAASTAPEESLGHLLVERAIIKEHTLQNAEELESKQVALLGRRLVDLGAMSEEEVQHAIRLKIKDTISDIVSHPEGKFDFVDERFTDKGSVSVSIDPGELLSGGDVTSEPRPARRTEPQKPVSKPKRPVSKPRRPVSEPQTDELQDDLSDPLLDMIEQFQGKFSATGASSADTLPNIAETLVPAPTLVDAQRPTPSRPPTTGTRPRTGVHRHSRPKTGLIAGVVASLALVSAGYWFFFHESADGGTKVPPKGASAGTTVEAPSSATPSSEASETPSPPAPRPETSASVDATAVAKKVAKKRATPRTTEPTRPSARAAPRTPPAPVTKTKSVATQAAPTAPPPATGETAAKPVAAQSGLPAPASGNTGQVDEPASAPDAAKQAQQVQEAPAVSTEPSATPSEVADASAGQPESSGWENAVFAPKRGIVVKNVPETESTVQPGDLVEPGFDVIDPVLIEHPELKYPKEAKRRKIPEAVVRVRVLVDENGAVLQTELEKSAGYGFDEAALAVAAQARFIPATKDRVQVKMWTVLPLQYRLKK
jgi:TonB family protein